MLLFGITCPHSKFSCEGPHLHVGLSSFLYDGLIMAVHDSCSFQWFCKPFFAQGSVPITGAKQACRGFLSIGFKGSGDGQLKQQH